MTFSYERVANHTCDCGRPAYLVVLACVVCLDLMRLTDAVTELERQRALWVRGQERNQDWKMTRQSFRMTSVAGTGFDLIVAPPLFRPDGRVAETVQECLSDLFAGGVTRDELDFAFTTATSRATQSVMNDHRPKYLGR